MTLHGDKSGGLIDHAAGESANSQEAQIACTSEGFAYELVIDDICNLKWGSLTQEDLINVAWAYYYFSTQFRESLEPIRISCA